MRKALLVAAPVCLILFGLFYFGFATESVYEVKYREIQVGMTVDEVEAILGPGTPMKQGEVPGMVVAVDPRDVEAPRSRAGRSGGPPPTVRDYPTRIKPIVEGDHILRWEDGRTRDRILVAFREGKVAEKHYYDPNYL